VPALAIGAAAWLIAGAALVVSFWSLTGQTPGMSIVGLRIVPLDQPRMDLRIAIRRLFGLALAVLTLGLGFLGIVFSERRRGLEDTIGHTEVHYELAERVAPWSEL
jgi:uncharacterized RDD family membrane protein YckC